MQCIKRRPYFLWHFVQVLFCILYIVSHVFHFPSQTGNERHAMRYTIYRIIVPQNVFQAKQLLYYMIDNQTTIFTDWLSRQGVKLCRSFFLFFICLKFCFAEKSFFFGVEFYFSRFASKNKWDTLSFLLRTGC